MIKPAVFAALMLAATAASVSFANDPIPVIDSPGVSRQVNTVAATSTNASGAARSPSQATEMLYQQEMLQQEVQTLRGIVEQQAHQIKQMREEQRDRYLDLDRRITLLGQAPARQATTENPAAPIARATNTPAAETTKPVTTPVVSQNDPVAEQEAYQAAFSLVRSKQYAEATKAFEQMIKKYPNGEYTGNAYYWLGEVLLVESHNEQALQAFGALLAQDPTHRKAADAKFKQGKIYLQMGDKARAKAAFQDVIKHHPSSSAAKLAEAEMRDAQL